MYYQKHGGVWKQVRREDHDYDYYSHPKSLHSSCHALANALREARAANGSARVVVLTGAGISTAAGIQDEVSSINCSDARFGTKPFIFPQTTPMRWMI